MDNKKLLNAKFLLDSFTYESVKSVTFAIIDKRIPEVVHYQSTNRIWKSFYINAPEAKKCHIMRTGSELAKRYNSFSIIWNSLATDNEESQYINEKRLDLNHCNGISICQNLTKDLLFCTLLTGNQDDPDFVQRVINSKAKLLQSIFSESVTQYAITKFS